MNKQLKKILFTIIIFFIYFSNVNAQGNYTISLSSSTVTKGKSVTLYINGSTIIGGFTISSSDTTVAYPNATTEWVENNTRTITISTLKPGTATIKVTPTTVSDSNGQDINLPSKTLTLTVSDKSNQSTITTTNENKNNDNLLKSLSIEGLNLNPQFDKNKFEYNVEAESDTEKVTIKAETNDPKARVNGIGEVKVSEGTNKIELVVTAENGTTRSYIINVNVKEAEPITVKVNGQDYTVVRKKDDLPDVDLFEIKEIEINGEKIDGYYNDKLKIYLVGLKDKNGELSMFIYDSKENSYEEYRWITVGGITLYIFEGGHPLKNFHKYITYIKNQKVNIYKINKQEKRGLIYGTNVLTGNTDYYLYDKEEETLARYYNGENEIYKDEVKKYKNYFMISLGAFSLIIIIMMFISIIKGIKSKKKVKRR